jgi:hypothetical protein
MPMTELDRRPTPGRRDATVSSSGKFTFAPTMEQVFRKVWELACSAGFLSGREAARCMLAHGRGSIFFTGATLSIRGGAGYAAFAAAK